MNLLGLRELILTKFDDDTYLEVSGRSWSIFHRFCSCTEEVRCSGSLCLEELDSGHCVAKHTACLHTAHLRPADRQRLIVSIDTVQIGAKLRYEYPRSPDSQIGT